MLFNKGLRKEKRNVPINDGHRDLSTIILQNDGVNICAEACASCWDTPLPAQYEDKITYIGKRAKIGHTSVLEHSNVVFYIEYPLNDSQYTTAMIDFLSKCRYLHTAVVFNDSHTIAYLLIGGTWRGYSDLFLMMNPMENILFRDYVLNLIYTYIPSCAMEDIIAQGYLDKDRFSDNYVDVSNYAEHTPHLGVNDNIEIVNTDSFNKFLANLKEACPVADKFSYRDLLDFCTITVLFRGVSRIITQQITRHRNGITQESQRYVNYKDAKFNSPTKYKPDKYNELENYPITFAGKSFSLRLQDIGENIIKLYGQLADRKLKHPLAVEDARAYLPNNTTCGKLYMTFTYRSFIKFLQLREDNHAQAEVREYGIALGKWFRGLYPWFEDCYDALKYCPIPGDTDNYTKYDHSIGSYTGPVVEEPLTEEELTELMEKHAENFNEEELPRVPVEDEDSDIGEY